MRAPWFIAAILLSTTASTFAQDPGVVLKIATRTIEVGEAVNVQLECINTGLPESPEATLPDGLELKLLGPTPSSNSMTQFINGRRTHRSTYTYSMRLTATKVGNYTLGPITVMADGVQYQTKPVRIVVRKTQQSGTPQADRLLFCTLEVTPLSLYVTQSFTATLSIGIRKVEINGRRIELDLIRQVLDTRASQLSVFENGRATTSERWLTDSAGNKHLYEIFRVQKQIRTEQVGDRIIGPVFLKANYPTRLRRGFFGRYEVSNHTRQTARAEAITVLVKGPPAEARPDNYTGAIGHYSLQVIAKPLEVELGEPITLTVAIGGAPLEGIEGPDLGAQPELASRFEYAKDDLAGDIENRKKTFRRAIFPKQPGEQTIPALRWSYFDPRQERYIALSSPPIPITVNPPSQQSGVALASPLNGPGEPKKTTLTVLSGGISPNYQDTAAALAQHAQPLTISWIAMLIISPTAWLVMAIAALRRERTRSDANWARRRGARRRARARVAAAVRQADPEELATAMADSLTDYIADRYGLSHGTLTPQEARDAMIANGVAALTAQEIAGFLERFEALRYALGTTNHTDSSKVGAQVRRWIDQIENTKA